MKLYDIPRGRLIKILEDNPEIPSAAAELKKNEILFFDHIDGMYSLCKDKNGNVVHLAAWTEVEIMEKG